MPGARVVSDFWHLSEQSVAGCMEAVENADTSGERNERVLRGNVVVVRERRERAAASSRSRAAVQAALECLSNVESGEGHFFFYRTFTPQNVKAAPPPYL